MGRIHHFKRFENNLVRKVKNGTIFIVLKIGTFFSAIFRFFFRRYTIVFVPHSEKRIFNFHVSIFSTVLVFLLIFGAAGTLFWHTFSPAVVQESSSDYNVQLMEAQANLIKLQEEVNQLSRAARGFEAALANALGSLGSGPGLMNFSAPTESSSFFGMPRSEDALREIDDIRHLAVFLSSAVQPVQEIGSILDSQSAILTEIPSVWPVRGGIGHFTAMFGITPDPFNGIPRMHTGVDISTYRSGDPVIATADGQIAYLGYQAGGYGNYIVIRHQHGFYTLFAHLLSFRVAMGQEVRQGETIGFIGSTGRSTGPHVHYEVHIGSDVVNPLKYLNIRPNPVR